MDISKDFDRVWHKGLLAKLEQLGISDSLYRWFESYLSGRSQRVVIDGQNSEWRVIQAGAPQGSVLGPLLFLFTLMTSLLVLPPTVFYLPITHFCWKK